MLAQPIHGLTLVGFFGEDNIVPPDEGQIDREKYQSLSCR